MKLVDEDEEEMTKDIWMDLDGAGELYGIYSRQHLIHCLILWTYSCT